jgi:hypothetical protein
MTETPMDETVEIDDQRFIALSYDRVWPKYVVSWSLRQRESEGDFPLASGAADALPPREGTPDALWERLRDQAMEAAQAAAARAPAAEPHRGLFARLFGR